jgi:integrase
MVTAFEQRVETILPEIPEKDRATASRYFLEKQASGLAMSSLRVYATALKTLSKMCSKPLLECDREDVLRLLIDVQERYKEPSLYKHVLRDMLRSDGRESVILGIRLNHKRTKREWQDPAKILTREDLQSLLAATTDLRDRAILALLWDTGGRVHEIAAIQVGDLKLENKKDSRTGKPVYSLWFRKQKIAGEERRVPLYESSSFILPWLRAHPDRENREAPLFISKRRVDVRPLTVKGIRGVIKQAATRAKIDKPCHPHSFRHARATDLKRLGVADDALRQWLGWARGSSMPLRYVSRRAEEQIAEVADKLGYEPLPPPGPVEELLPEELMPEDLPTVVLDEKAIVEKLFEKMKAWTKEELEAGHLHLAKEG